MFLLMLRGLSGSGKTTFANEYCKNHPNTVNICKDDIRFRFPDLYPNEVMKEKKVILTRDQMVISAFENGKDVIVSDTNLNPIHEKRLRELAEEYKADFIIKDFTDVHYEECINRDKKRPRGEQVGVAVIMEMYYKYLYKKPAIYEDLRLDNIYLMDIDGSLALNKTRDPHDTSKYLEDSPNTPVVRLMQTLGTNNFIIVSGRDERYREVTEYWLKHSAGISGYINLFMRPAEDVRPDHVIKKEIYEAHIKGKYNVLGVFDDRKRVKRAWVDLGIFVFDLNQFDAEF